MTEKSEIDGVKLNSHQHIKSKNSLILSVIMVFLWLLIFSGITFHTLLSNLEPANYVSFSLNLLDNLTLNQMDILVSLLVGIGSLTLSIVLAYLYYQMVDVQRKQTKLESKAELQVSNYNIEKDVLEVWLSNFGRASAKDLRVWLDIETDQDIDLNPVPAVLRKEVKHDIRSNSTIKANNKEVKFVGYPRLQLEGKKGDVSSITSRLDDLGVEEIDFQIKIGYEDNWDEENEIEVFPSQRTLNLTDQKGRKSLEFLKNNSESNLSIEDGRIIRTSVEITSADTASKSHFEFQNETGSSESGFTDPFKLGISYSGDMDFDQDDVEIKVENNSERIQPKVVNSFGDDKPDYKADAYVIWSPENVLPMEHAENDPSGSYIAVVHIGDESKKLISRHEANLS